MALKFPNRLPVVHRQPVATSCANSYSCDSGLVSVLLGNGEGTFKTEATRMR